LGDWKNPKPIPQIASRQATSSEAGHHDERGRPRCDQDANLNRRQAADVLEIERQCHEGDQLRGVRTDGGCH
jgi:hypothetical protein